MRKSNNNNIRVRIGLVTIFGVVILSISMSVIGRQKTSNVVVVEAADAAVDGSYLGQARKLLDSGMQQSHQGKTSSAYNSLMPNDDPRVSKMLRESIGRVTDLINNYRQNGLSNMPNLPNLPGIGTFMRLPDKLLRAELSMLQDEIRMAQEMMQNPLAATMNAPRDIASMLSRMAEQLEQ